MLNLKTFGRLSHFMVCQCFQWHNCTSSAQKRGLCMTRRDFPWWVVHIGAIGFLQAIITVTVNGDDTKLLFTFITSMPFALLLMLLFLLTMSFTSFRWVFWMGELIKTSAAFFFGFRMILFLTFFPVFWRIVCVFSIVTGILQVSSFVFPLSTWLFMWFSFH